MIDARHALLLGLLAFAPVLPAGAQAQEITRVADVLALNGEDAIRQPKPVRLKGVVLGVSTLVNFFSLNDGTGTVGVMRQRVQNLKQGDIVEVTGRTMATRFNGATHPRVATDSVVITGSGELPKARPVSVKTFSDEENYDQWARIEGHVMEWRHLAPDLFLKLVTPEGYIEANLPVPDATLIPERLHGARLRLTGTIVSVPDRGRVLFVPEMKQMEVIEPGTGDIFEAPLVSIRDVIQRKVEAGKRWRVSGVLATRMQERQIILTGPDGAMMNYALQPRVTEEPGATYGDAGPWPQLNPGDTVEMVGSIVDGWDADSRSYGLTWCHLRVTGHGDPPVPETIDLETLKNLRNDDRWATVECTVGAWMLSGGSMLYAVFDERMNHSISVRNSPPGIFPDDLHNARMKFTGFATSLTPSSAGAALIVPDPSFTKLIEPGKADSFDVPEFSAAEISSGRVPLGRRIRSQGVVIGRLGGAVYVRGKDGALCLNLQYPWSRPASAPGMFFADCGPVPAFSPGDEVQIMGSAIRNSQYPGIARFDLVSTNVRVAGERQSVEPVVASLSSVFNGAHTSDLVEIHGRLLALQQVPVNGGEWRTTMLLESDGVKLPVNFQGPGRAGFDTLKVDDDVIVRGMVDRATSHDPRQLWLISEADAKSLGLSAEVRNRRLRIWGGSAAGVLLVLLAWIAMLRRASRIQARSAVELKAANKAARESEQRWKLLFEQSPLSVQIFSPDGQTMRFNQAWKTLFRHSDEEGYAFNVLKDPDLNASGAVNLIRKAFEGEVVHVPPVPFPVKTDPPETRWIGGVLYPVKNEAGEIMEVVTVHNDITEQKRAEDAMLAINQTLEQRVKERTVELNKAQADLSRTLDQERELNELKSRFISMVSHEFRTPLGITMSAIELMRHYDDRLPQGKREELQQDIFNATRLMAGLMEEVLVLGRVEAGKLTCKAEPCDLEVLSSKLADETLSATNRRCLVNWRTEGDLSGAHADEALLRHIFSNLITNAVKYSPDGGEVDFILRREGDAAVFQVIDHGIGIPESDRARLFEAFHRCGNVGEIPGTGLGLVIVKRCVDLHGGSMEIESVVGEGTTFTVRLPLFARQGGFQP